MNKETVHRSLVVGLLAAILLVQIISLFRTPDRPLRVVDFYGPAFKRLTPSQRQALLMEVPVVRINGPVEVESPLAVTIEK